MTVKAFAKVPLFILAGGLSSAQATEFLFGPIQAQWDNTVSYGIGWRLEDPSKEQVHPGNAAALGIDGEASSYNFDDGTLNYEQGDMYTQVAKWTTELELQYQNYGALLRGRAYYDSVIMDETPHFKAYNDDTKDTAGRGLELQDAYVWGDFNIADTPLNLRLGRQVVSWGESTFIQGGINSINPVDASAFRKPGAEVKEGLLPVNMFYGSVGLTDSISIEGFYLLEWEKTKSDPCGTLFSTTDFAADGCGPVVLAGNTDERVILQAHEQQSQNPPITWTVPIAERLADDEAKDSGQYGVALRWYEEEYTDTEFGFYYMNIHSRLPVIGGVLTNRDPLVAARIQGLQQALAGTSDPAVQQNIGQQIQGALPSLYPNPDPVINGNYPQYQMMYPENQKIMGISFATSSTSGASISGELTYKPDTPLQWNSLDTLVAGVGLPTSRLYQARLAEEIKSGGNKSTFFGTEFEAFDELDVWQAQLTYIQTFDRILAADRLAVVAEVGATYIPDLPDLDEARFGRSGSYGLGDSIGVWTAEQGNQAPHVDNCQVGPAANITPKNCNDEGYTDQLSGGIRIRSTLDYNNAFAGMNVSPRLSVSYDQGNGPEPGSQFIDDRLTTGLAVEFVYLNKISAEVAYTNYSGGKYNVLKNHDTFNLSAKYSF